MALGLVPAVKINGHCNRLDTSVNGQGFDCGDKCPCIDDGQSHLEWYKALKILDSIEHFFYIVEEFKQLK